MQSSPTSKRKSKIIFYDAKLDAPTYIGVLERLAEGRTRSGDNPESIGDSGLFSIRASKKVRILYTQYVLNKQPVYLVLDILENHEYKKSKFLNPKLLKKYRDGAREMLSKVVLKPTAKASDFNQKEHTSKTKPRLKLAPVLAFGDEYILFDKNQEQVLKAKLPLVVEGPPGSGKTSVSFSLLEKAAAKHLKVLYVTQSKNLALYVKQAYIDGGEHKNNNVHIMHYQALDASLTSDAKPSYLSWLDKKIRTIHDKKLSSFIMINKSRIYQEFRILSGYAIDDYLNFKVVGKKQSIFSKPEERKHVAELYQAWQIHIKSLSERFAEFSELKIDEESQYDQVIVDESQDFSHGQLRSLCKLAKHNNLIFCIDRRQNLADENPKLIFLKNLLTMDRVPPTCIQLKECYRCPPNIMEVACVFNQWRLQLDGGKHKKESSFKFNKMSKGHLRWITPSNLDELNELKGRKDDADTCIITQSKYVKEAKEHFESALVFTPEQIKGLQFKTVIAYKILEDSIFYNLNRILSKPITQATIGFSAPLSACFVAITRASKELIFIQDKKQHTLKHLTEPLSSHFIKAEQSTRFTKPKISDKKKWAKRYAQLKLQGLDKKAAEVLDRYFKAHGKSDPEIQAVTQVDGLCDGVSSLSIQAVDNSNVQSGSQQQQESIESESPCEGTQKLRNEKIEKNNKGSQKKLQKKSKKKRHNKRKLKAEKKKNKKSTKNGSSFNLNDIEFERKNMYRRIFLDACEAGNLNEIKRVIEFTKNFPIDLNYRDKEGYTGLEYACRSWHRDVIKYLLSQDKLIDILSIETDVLKSSDLYVKKLNLPAPSLLVKWAIELSDSEIFNLILRKIKRKSKVDEHTTVPMAHRELIRHVKDNNLCEIKKITAIEPMLNNPIDQKASTILHVAATNKQIDEHTILYLLNKGADIFKQNLFGDTPLMSAIKTGHRAFIKVSIEHAHSTNKLNDLLSTKNLISTSPVLQAFQSNDHKTINMIINAGYNIRDFLNHNFLHHLIIRNECITHKILKLILDNLEDYYFHKDSAGRTPLDCAKVKFPKSITAKKIEIFTKLVRDSNIMKAKSYMNKTLIDSYLKGNTVDFKNLLKGNKKLSIGDISFSVEVDINYRDENNCTLLDHAVMKQDDKMIGYLCSLPNIDIYSKSLLGKRPYMAFYGLQSRSLVFEHMLRVKSEPGVLKLAKIINPHFKLPRSLQRDNTLIQLIKENNIKGLKKYLKKIPASILKAKDMFGNTTIFEAFGHNFKMAKLMIESSKDSFIDCINQPNFLSVYPIQCVLPLGLKPLKWLINKGANPHVRSFNNFTLLHCACILPNTNISVIKFLIQQYPDMLFNDDNHNKWKPIDCARTNNDEVLCSFLQIEAQKIKLARSKSLTNLEAEKHNKAQTNEQPEFVFEFKPPSTECEFESMPKQFEFEPMPTDFTFRAITTQFGQAGPLDVKLAHEQNDINVENSNSQKGSLARLS